MKPHPRIRKTIKWGGAAVTVLLAVVWIGSGWWYVAWICPNRLSGQLHDGVGYFAYSPSGTVNPTFGIQRVWFRRLELTHFKGERLGGGWYLRVSLWPAAALCVIPTVAAWRFDMIAGRRARARLGLCPKCRYDRAGIAGDAKCPECGSSAP